MSSTTQRQTADAIIAAFNRMDIAAILSFRAPSCMRHFSPRSVPHASQTNEEYAAELERIVKIFRNFELIVHEVIEDVTTRKICMWLSTKAETAVGPYLNEYMWVFQFDESGEKVTEVREFVDSKYSMEFLPKMVGAIKQAKQESAAERSAS